MVKGSCVRTGSFCSIEKTLYSYENYFLDSLAYDRNSVCRGDDGQIIHFKLPGCRSKGAKYLYIVVILSVITCTSSKNFRYENTYYFSIFVVQILTDFS
jgi:hypothetical protein